MRALLSPGDNVVAVMATLTSDVGGLAVKLVVRYPGKEPETLFSDRQWKAADQPAAGWTEMKFDDSRWKAAAEVAPFGQRPLGQ